MSRRIPSRVVPAALAGALVGSIAAVPMATAADPPLTVTAESATVPCPNSCLTVTSSRFFELRFDTGTGGGIDRFFDLAEDPGRAYDLAGGVTTSTGPWALHDFAILAGGVPYSPSNNVTDARLDLLEATPTRVKVRQESFYQSGAAGPILAGVKAIGDYSTYPSGRTALRWERRTTSAVTYTSELGELAVHLLGTAPLNGWTAYRELAPGTMPGVGSDAFLMAQNELAGARTDFLHILHKTWTTANGYLGSADLTNMTVSAPNERMNLFWDDTTGGSLLAGTSQVWNSLTYFKPTNLESGNPASPWLSPAVTLRSSDYRAPALLSVSTGSQWVDAAENTAAASDWFNESEAAYALEMDPVLGLDFGFDIGGSPGQPRYSPVFKIRRWHALGPPRQITFGGRTLVRYVDYHADVKPVSRAHWAPRLLWHCSVEGTPGAGDCTTPDVGKGAAGGGQNGVSFVPGRYGKAASFTTAPDQFVSADPADFNAAEGAIEFWYQPGYDSVTDSQDRVLWSRLLFDGTNYYCYQFLKTASKALSFRVGRGTTSTCTTFWGVTSSLYSWRAYDWVHLETTWSAGGTLQVLVNGKLLLSTSLSGFAPGPTLAAPLQPTYFGGCPSTPGCSIGATGHAMGLIDEPRIYGPLWSGNAATYALADGGLLSDAQEYLASSARNFGLAFSAVDASKHGPYLYLGADSKFRGVNVWLAAPGAGSNPLPDWQYWNGSTGEWQALPGLLDDNASTTIRFQSSGSVYWSDPAGWAPYSVDGSPDLYYVRVRLLGGDYASAYPIVAMIKTDILLLQYDGDVAVPGQTLVLPPPSTSPLNVSDLKLDKTGTSTTAEQWETVPYTLQVTNLGPSDATNVQLLDPLPPGLEFVSFSLYTAGGSCGYAAATRTFSCSFPWMPVGTFQSLTLNAMVLAAGGDVVNGASVTADQTDPDSSNDVAEWAVSVTTAPSDAVPFLTVTSSSSGGARNVVEFVNPAGTSGLTCADRTVVLRHDSDYPSYPGFYTAILSCSAAADAKKCTCVDSAGLTPGKTYYYGAFANFGAAPGRFDTGRPPDASQAAVKWAFSTGTFGLAAPTVTQYGVFATSNDQAVYSMQRGASGGLWSTGAPLGDWRPYRLGGIVQSRSPFVPAPAVGEDTVYLGAQDGQVYALNAQTGNAKASWFFPQLGATLQAAPAGVFFIFGGGQDDLMVGTRDFGNDNLFCALTPLDGSWAGGTMSASCYGGVDPPASPGRLGIINGMASVQYGSPPFVYFASHVRDAQPGNDQTLWRLRLGSAPVLQYDASLPLGDIDSSPILANDASGARRVYVGSSTATGTLYSLRPDLSAIDRSLPISNGQVKGFVLPDRANPGNVYFATDDYVWGVYDDGTSLGFSFSTGLVPGVRPSSPVLLANGSLYVGGTDGRLYKISPSGSLLASVRLGDGKAVVGAPSYDAENDLVHVGTEAGVFYAVDPTLVQTDPTCVPASSCTGANRQACYVSNATVECPSYECQGAATCAPN
jgi:uncharacterized repeat protein (TIGR01451 family)